MSRAHDVLGVRPGSTPEEIRRAYKRRAFELHPDRHGGGEVHVERFKTLQLAYEVLLEQALPGLPPPRDDWDEPEPVRPRARRTRVSQAQNFDPLDPLAGDMIWKAYVEAYSWAGVEDEPEPGGGVW